jgi:hypothetical protein
MTDPFFETIHDSEGNACVGKQGSATNYVEGYLEAATLLAAAVLDHGLSGSRDTLAMPILYNVRHGLELGLKFALSELTKIGMTKPRLGDADHDIRAYWEHLSRQEVGDRRVRLLVADLRPYVESLGRIDDDGQELRYFENRAGERSLGDIAVVNLPHVRKSVARLRDLLNELTDWVLRLAQENVTGTKTPRCSRADLREIASMVGQRSSWSEDSFLERRAAVKKRFEMGSGGFSAALNAIQQSRELAATIGVETPLEHLTDEQAEDLASNWLKVNPPPPRNAVPRIVSARQLRRAVLADDRRDASALTRQIAGTLSLKAFADVSTVFYIGRDCFFGEEYVPRLTDTIAAHRLEDCLITTHNLLSKTNFLDGFIAGLRLVGRPSLADRLAALQEGARR